MLPEVGAEVLQEHVGGGEMRSGSGTALATTEEAVPSIKKEDMWTPEDFLESTLHVHEDKGFLEDFSLPIINNHVATKITSSPKVTKPRSRRKNQWKLKFHHQALPPEYLDHYEASLNKTRPMAEKSQGKLQKNSQSNALHSDAKSLTPLSMGTLPNESIQNWLQRITLIQNEIQRNNTMANYPNIAPAIPPQTRNLDVEKRKKNQTQSNSSKVVNYQDLPYMGEMTLNNSKPRRGRKPKKADICHLIYKNYGTIFPGTPTHLVDERINHPGASNLDKYQMKIEKPDMQDVITNNSRSKTDLQNRIISSLLEKRLSQESKKPKETKTKKCKIVQTDSANLNFDAMGDADGEEPLNLCVRDLNNLKIRVHRKYGNIYETSSVSSSTVTEKNDIENLISCSEVVNASSPLLIKTESVSPTPKMNIPDFKKAIHEATTSDTIISNSETPPLPGYVYWPNAGVFVHPMALQSQLMYYQKIAANSNYTLPISEDTSESTMPSRPSSIDSEAQMPIFQKPIARDTKRSVIPKQISELLDPSILSKQVGSINDINDSLVTDNSTDKQKLKRNASQNSFGLAHGKRKRSAIFIPPLPTENNNNPTTEVSICKFKFTGGAKPSLQEKKMLSVDSGGNFRYYSGTGDKANRGYEFFPRETLQQPAGSDQASSSGVFLNTSGEKITAASTSVPITDDKLYSKINSVPSTSVIKQTSPTNSEICRRKRKSRKSIQREKLEQTFKEKGFLIQTQQLESAEGATYCKFRQLRKFTRYLFRSWKDYLPENLQNEEGGNQDVSIPIAGESSSESHWS